MVGCVGSSGRAAPVSFLSSLLMPESMFLWDEDYFRVLLLESRPRLGAEEDVRVQAFVVIQISNIEK